VKVFWFFSSEKNTFPARTRGSPVSYLLIRTAPSSFSQAIHHLPSMVCASEKSGEYSHLQNCLINLEVNDIPDKIDPNGLQ
jgi:hypothetical protein